MEQYAQFLKGGDKRVIEIKDYEEESYIMPGNNFNQKNIVHTEKGICRTIIGQGHAGNEPNSEGICNTLTSVQKDNLVLEPKIIDPQGRTNKQCTPTKHCPTLRAEAHGNLPQVILPNKQYRIRKLTPKEGWRLTGISDKDFHKAEQVNSNTQLYKQAGNAIVVSVLEAV